MPRKAQEPPDNKLIECTCGCGQTLIKYAQYGKGAYKQRRYIHGHNSQNLRAEMECEFCDKLIIVPRYKLKRNKHHFCSRECAGQFRRTRKTVVCPNCNKYFEVAHWRTQRNEIIFCSKNCLSEYRNVTTNCNYCGKEITRPQSNVRQYDRIYCNRECQHNWLSENLYGEKHPSWLGTRHQPRGKNWAKMRRKTLRRDSYQCRLCGSKEDIAVHHLIPVRNFDIPEQSNTLENLISLCRSCHAKIEPRKAINPANERLKQLIRTKPFQSCLKL